MGRPRQPDRRPIAGLRQQGTPRELPPQSSGQPAGPRQQAAWASQWRSAGAESERTAAAPTLEKPGPSASRRATARGRRPWRNRPRTRKNTPRRQQGDRSHDKRSARAPPPTGDLSANPHAPALPFDPHGALIAASAAENVAELPRFLRFVLAASLVSRFAAPFSSAKHILTYWIRRQIKPHAKMLPGVTQSNICSERRRWGAALLAPAPQHLIWGLRRRGLRPAHASPQPITWCRETPRRRSADSAR